MAKSAPTPPGDEPKKKVADANWLMGDSAKSKPKAKPRPVAPEPTGPQADDDHSYDLAGDDGELFGDAEEPVAPVPPVARPDSKASRQPKLKDDWDASEAPSTRPHEDDEEQVEQIWTRSGEWGTHLFWVGLVAAGVVFLLYKAVLATQFFVAFLILIVGGAILLALCYPIFITLERPVRITPEQAAKDYYAMLSYPFPFYPRMWLLLSTAGREADEFKSYGKFKSYWKRKLAAIQGGKAAFPNPLKFQVENFASDKSVGQTSLLAKYTLKVFKGDPGPGNKELAAYQISARVVKGPDRMWYLSSGTLPAERKEAANKGGWGP
jgi:hypothetical protein